jgi:hypothetical protein
MLSPNQQKANSIALLVALAQIVLPAVGVGSLSEFELTHSMSQLSAELATAFVRPRPSCRLAFVESLRDPPFSLQRFSG